MNNRIPSVPLIVHDPYFSIWSPADHLNDTETVSWTGKELALHGTITVDGNAYNFMGKQENLANVTQISQKITPTQSIFTFANEQISFTIIFSQHFDLADLQSISEPITYVSLKVESTDHVMHQVQVRIQFDGHLTYENLIENRLVTKQLQLGDTQEVFIGKARQTPLNSSGDLIDIDWGYLYLAVEQGVDQRVSSYQDWNQQGVQAEFDLSTATMKDTKLLVAYDDLQSINYFGIVQNAYWKAHHNSLPVLLAERLEQFNDILNDCKRINSLISDQARQIGGDDYELICATAYRQAIAAHKLIRDENGEVIFLSKECNSNGCIGTVDVSYPSIPLFLMFQPELVVGMMRPIFRFAKLPIWNYDFAPHDVGRYPYATGQVYGMNNPLKQDDGTAIQERDTVGMYYQFPASSNMYEFESQMPVEECGDMIIMASMVGLLGHLDFVETNYDLLIQWSQFLINNGQDPNNQLCTDDFAGHLAHNVNLSLKAIVALAALGKTLQKTQYHEQGEELSDQAMKMARTWQDMAKSSTDTKLAFDQEDTWSLKYNLVWSDILQLNLFPDSVKKNEIKRYLEKMNDYGTPLDSRADYTKVDWLMWVAALTENKNEFNKFTAPVVNFLNNTTDRQPFSDWFDTKTGKMVAFKNRSVIGGVFMPLFQAAFPIIKKINEVKE